MLTKIILTIREQGYVDVDAISKKLGMARSTIEGVLQHLVTLGYLALPNSTTPPVGTCGGCTVFSCGGCALQALKHEELPCYFLTEKGKQFRKQKKP